MRAYELECIHGIGHSSGVHGCDGCCALLIEPATDAEHERIVKLLEEKIQAISLANVHEREGMFASLRLIKGEQSESEKLDAPIVKGIHPPVGFRDKGNGE